MSTPVEILLAVLGLDGGLSIEGDRLRTRLPANCPAELKQAIRQYKAALIELLRLNLLIVCSDVLNCVVFWTPDEATKESLAAAGADRGSIYTIAELEALARRGVNAGELPLIHAAKQRFSGNVTEL